MDDHNFSAMLSFYQAKPRIRLMVLIHFVLCTPRFLLEHEIIHREFGFI